MRLRVRFAMPAILVVAVGVGAAQTIHWRASRVAADAAPICRVRTADHVIALTFDDGPDPSHTRDVLAMLDAAGAHATFFVIGRHAVADPELIAAIADGGDELGNHTWSHPHLDGLDTEEISDEIDRGAESVSPTSALFRAPFGVIDGDALVSVRDHGYVAVHWSVPFDHLVAGAATRAEATRAVIDDIAPGDIVLAHDADDGAVSRDRSIEVLGLVLPMLREAGYQVVTVSELLSHGELVRAAPRPWFWQSGFGCPRD